MGVQKLAVDNFPGHFSRESQDFPIPSFKGWKSSLGRFLQSCWMSQGIQVKKSKSITT